MTEPHGARQRTRTRQAGNLLRARKEPAGCATSGHDGQRQRTRVHPIRRIAWRAIDARPNLRPLLACRENLVWPSACTGIAHGTQRRTARSSRGLRTSDGELYHRPYLCFRLDSASARARRSGKSQVVRPRAWRPARFLAVLSHQRRRRHATGSEGSGRRLASSAGANGQRLRRPVRLGRRFEQRDRVAARAVRNELPFAR